MRRYLIVPVMLLITACGNMFDTHPYDVNVHGEKNINKKQMAVIESRFADKDTLRVAFISDTHLWLSDARDQVEEINHRDDIDFVVHCGDLTDMATGKEYEWSRDILMKLNCPFVALIGNHDYLGTGDQTYDCDVWRKRFLVYCLTSEVRVFEYQRDRV
jgi:predicted MPP superfamily phosphohydrolase